jgi:hypothetical protein
MGHEYVNPSSTCTAPTSRTAVRYVSWVEQTSFLRKLRVETIDANLS